MKHPIRAMTGPSPFIARSTLLAIAVPAGLTLLPSSASAVTCSIYSTTDTPARAIALG
jgi:hypothetical protein